MTRTLALRCGAAALVLGGCAPRPDAPADAIYVGGNVVTMDSAGTVAEAVAVRDGKVLSVGTREALLQAHRSWRTRVVDLQGRTLVPGFVDAYGQLLLGMALAGQADVGASHEPDEVAEALRRFARTRRAKPGDFVIGYGYDPPATSGSRALTRDELDAALPDNPAVVMLGSGRGAVLNSAALSWFGISAGTTTPPGGVIARRPGTREPTGLLLERSWFTVQRQLPPPAASTAEQLRFAQRRYAAGGVTTAQATGATAEQIDLLADGADRGELIVDVVAYPAYMELDRVLTRHLAVSFGTYRGRFKLGGVSMAIDGVPETRTAYRTRAYRDGGPNGEPEWRGARLLTGSALDAAVRRCYHDRLQLHVEASGDAAIDMLLEAHRTAAADSPALDRRTTVVHSQFVRADQLKKFADYRLIPSFHSGQLFQLGETADGDDETPPAPILSALRLGLRPTNHVDLGTLPLDPMFTLWSAVTRMTHLGAVIGPTERLSAAQALRAVTLDAAYQIFEEKTKGSIEPGKLADLVILSENPLAIPAEGIRRIRVLETIKEGKTIYRAPEAPARVALRGH